MVLKEKGSVKNQNVDGSDYINGVIMGVPPLSPMRSLTSGYGLLGDGSSASSFIPFNHSVNQVLNVMNGISGHLSSSGLLKGYNEQNLEGLVEQGLCDDLYRMHIGKGAGGYGGVSLASHKYSFGEQEYNVDDSVRAFCSDSQKERMDNLLEMSKWQKRGYHGGKSKFQNPCVMNRQSFGEGEGLFSSGCHGNDDGGGGTFQDVQLIFDGIIDHIVEFMVDQFGNYLMQKLLNFCNDEQRMQILLRNMGIVEDANECVNGNKCAVRRKSCRFCMYATQYAVERTPLRGSDMIAALPLSDSYLPRACPPPSSMIEPTLLR
nr:putative pumilio homolog 7, chloroplastic [Ipomoea batatas]